MKKTKLSSDSVDRTWKAVSVLLFTLCTAVLFLLPEVKHSLLSVVKSHVSFEGSYPPSSNAAIKKTGLNVDDVEEKISVQEINKEVEMADHKENLQTAQTVTHESEDLKRAVIMNDHEKTREILMIQPELASFPDENGWQPIHEAARALALNSMKVLVEEFGADINASTFTTALTPLTLALSNTSEEGTEKQSEMISYLQTYNYKSTRESASTNYHRSDLIHASREDDIDLMTQIILMHPEYVHEADENGWQPLHEAVRAGKVYAMSHLIEFGHADVNAQTINGMTPLFMANQMFQETDPIIVEYLLRMGGIEKGPIRDEDL